ncbi:unnamed protein product [Blepharisma stoltei]|uniref:RING-type domain-containing protein n=1 Tax=Blepharisma stoltei TaxID=1481888 RepID=A0AAU9JG29_9CILI|nr:unnamed protein product [Blepharisma stoltei]
MNILYKPKPLRTPKKTSYSQSLPKLNKIATCTHHNKCFFHSTTAPDLSPAATDRVFVKELEVKIESQRKDLEERNVALDSLATHFENLVKMYKEEKNKTQELKEKNLDLLNENLVIRKNFEEYKAKKKAEGAIVTEGNNDYENLKIELVDMKKELENKNLEYTNEINNLYSQNEELENKIKGLEKVLKDEKNRYENEIVQLQIKGEFFKKDLLEANKKIQELEEAKPTIILMHNDEQGSKKIELVENETETDKNQFSDFTEMIGFFNNFEKPQIEVCLGLGSIEIPSGCDWIKKAEALQDQVYKLTDQMSLMAKHKQEAEEKLDRALVARKEIVFSVEEMRKNQQIETFKYEKLIQNISTEYKYKEAEIKELEELYKSSDSQRKFITESLRELEINNSQLTEKLEISNIKIEELTDELNKLKEQAHQKEIQYEEIDKKAGKTAKWKDRTKTLIEENKELRQRNLKLEKNLGEAANKMEREKEKVRNSEYQSESKIRELQIELNNEKNINTVHSQEILRLKSSQVLKEKESSKFNVSNDDSRSQSRIQQLETDLAKFKEENDKLLKTQEYFKNLLSNKTQQITQLEIQIDEAKAEINNPQFKNLQLKFDELCLKEENIAKILDKIKDMFTAFDAYLSCCVCSNTVEDAVAVDPCGHLVCTKCKDDGDINCPQCLQRIQGFIRVKHADDMNRKILEQRQLIAEILN